jgi:hypothetical protein
LSPEYAPGSATLGPVSSVPKQWKFAETSAILAAIACLLAIVDLYNVTSFGSSLIRTIVIIAMFCIAFPGLILGVAGLNSASHKKVYALLGIVVNLLGLIWAAILLFFMFFKLSIAD